nr:putative capsid [Marmot picobirnavirus]
MANKKYSNKGKNYKDRDHLTDTGAEGKWDKKGKKMGDHYNDPMWYAQNEALLNDAASFAYSWPLGSRISLGADFTSQSIPGILTYRLAPAIGKSTDAYSAVNVASKQLYSWIRHANSGAKNYESADLMMYILATTEAYAYYEWLKRIYGMAQIYSVTNRYYPFALISSNGVNYKDVMYNLADLRYYINQYAVKLGSLCIPAGMTYTQRRRWVFQNYYVDSKDTAKAQTYMFIPDGFWSYDELSGPGTLKYNRFTPPPAGYSVHDLMEDGNVLLEFLLASEDIGIMSGDILKAYTKDGIEKVSDIDESYMVLPSYSEEVLWQINNATVLPSPDANSMDVTQDASIGSGAILFNPKWTFIADQGSDFSRAGLIYTWDRLCNMTHDDVKPAETMVATRLMAVLEEDPTVETGLTYVLNSAGSDFCVGCNITRFLIDNSSDVQSWELEIEPAPDYAVTIANPTPESLNIVSELGLLENFDWHHMTVFSFRWDQDVQAWTDSLFQDVSNYAIIPAHGIAKMNDTAILSLFSAPQVARYSK